MSESRMAEYDGLMQEEYDYEEYREERCAAEERPMPLDEWRERSKEGWWGLR